MLFRSAYWKRASTQGALLSIVLGIGCWQGAAQLAADALVPANLVGLAASVVGMLLGSLAPQLLANKGHSIATALQHAAHATHGHAPAAHAGAAGAHGRSHG